MTPKNRKSDHESQAEAKAAEAFAIRFRQVLAMSRCIQNEVARELGVSPSVLSKVTSGKFRRFGLGT
ncbi:MAG TPA: hypothetical protein VM238_03085, partial [Phycisphaerae bacterium]|nr:hypothetical protein [Phycisphaerae bacterium]